MAPEQARGEELDARSDLFSFGAVLYEMATGAQAFPGSTNAIVFHALLGKDSPSLLNPVLAPSLERVVVKALQKNRELRYQSAAEIRADLDAVPRAKPQIMIPSALLACALSLVAFLAWYVAPRSSPSAPQAAPGVHRRPSIAVLGFKNLSGAPSRGWLSAALAEMLTTEMAAGGKLRAVAGQNIARVKMDLSLPDTDAYARDTLSQIRTNLNADYVVVGSFLTLGSDGNLRLDVRLQDARSGDILAAIAESGRESDVAGLVTRAGGELREKLGVEGISVAEAQEVQAALPSDPEVARLYAEGLTRLRVFDALGAPPLLEKAVAADPKDALAHSALSKAWSDLGYEARTEQEARRAFDLSGGLPPERKLTVEGRYRETRHEWDKASEIYRALYDFFPDNLDYALLLAEVRISAGKPRDGLAVLQPLRQSPDRRIEAIAAWAYKELADFPHQEQAAAKSLRLARLARAKLQVAQALNSWGLALQSLGRAQGGYAALEEAKGIFAQAGNRKAEANVLNNLATLGSDAGDYPRAAALFEEAGAISKQIGYLTGVALASDNAGTAVLEQGDYRKALALCRQALTMYRRMDARPNLAAALLNSGSASFAMCSFTGSQTPL